jgi:hypothetical protein
MILKIKSLQEGKDLTRMKIWENNIKLDVLLAKKS